MYGWWWQQLFWFRGLKPLIVIFHKSEYYNAQKRVANVKILGGGGGGGGGNSNNCIATLILEVVLSEAMINKEKWLGNLTVACLPFSG